MAIFSYGPEDAPGGYKDEYTSGVTSVVTSLSNGNAGSNIITFSSAPPATITSGVYITNAAASPSEVRRVLEVDGNDVFLDYPISKDWSEAGPATFADGATGNSSCLFIPGAYESVTVPDVQPEFNPRYFLNQNNDRNWTYIYRGRESFAGSASNIILLDATPLVYILGNARHSNEIGTGTAEYYRHIIYESAVPPSMTWDLQLRDSNNVSDNDFNRRYVGGILNRGTISANEGEILMMGWDDVQFLDMIHNQTGNSAITGSTEDNDLVERSSRRLIVASDAIANRGGTVGDNQIGYPITEPYYFSSGVVSFFGVPFARVRSFRLEVNNNIEARYYIRRSVGKRGPTEFQAQNRQLTMTATMAMDDTITNNNTTRTLWKEFIQQGNYQGFGSVPQLQGFDLELTFSKGRIGTSIVQDSIKILSPYKGSSNDDVTTTAITSNIVPNINANEGTGFGAQGCFFRRASHNLGTESPIQIDGEIIMRNVAIDVIDAIDGDDYPI